MLKSELKISDRFPLIVKSTEKFLGSCKGEIRLIRHHQVVIPVSRLNRGIDRVSIPHVIPERYPIKLVSESINRITFGDRINQGSIFEKLDSRFRGNDRSADPHSPHTRGQAPQE